MDEKLAGLYLIVATDPSGNMPAMSTVAVSEELMFSLMFEAATKGWSVTATDMATGELVAEAFGL